MFGVRVGLDSVWVYGGALYTRVRNMRGCSVGVRCVCCVYGMGGCSWVFVGVSECLWVFMMLVGVCGCVWVFVGVYGCL